MHYSLAAYASPLISTNVCVRGRGGLRVPWPLFQLLSAYCFCMTTTIFNQPPMRVGEGWDVHALAPGRQLMLGGVHIPHHSGLVGHSDADALLHAITDALLGAAGLGDIGTHFPDTDPRFKGADSAVLLAEALRAVQAVGYTVGNVDCTVVAQAPKLAPYKAAMRERIAQVLQVAPEQVNVKAKTAEKLGPVGEGLSMEARATVLLYRA